MPGSYRRRSRLSTSRTSRYKRRRPMRSRYARRRVYRGRTTRRTTRRNTIFRPKRARISGVNNMGDTCTVTFKDVDQNNLTADPGGYTFMRIPGNIPRVFLLTITPPDPEVPVVPWLNFYNIAQNYRYMRIKRCTLRVDAYNRQETPRQVGILQGRLGDENFPPNPAVLLNPAENPRTVYKTVFPNVSSRSVVTLKASSSTKDNFGNDHFKYTGGDWILLEGATNFSTLTNTAKWNWFVYYFNPTVEDDSAGCYLTVTMYYRVQFFGRRTIPWEPVYPVTAFSSLSEEEKKKALVVPQELKFQKSNTRRLDPELGSVDENKDAVDLT